MHENDKKVMDAIRVARMYYYQDLTTELIAGELNISRSKVSRLLSYAKERGLVEIRVRDPDEHANAIEHEIQQRYDMHAVKVVSVPEIAHEREWLDRVANFAASYLNTVLESNMVLAIAWGTTVSTMSTHLTPKPLVNVDIVQLNGSGNTHNIGNTYASEILMRFAHNYSARVHLFPVPTFFDYRETKEAMWRERSIKHVLAMQTRADVLLYSIGAFDSGVPSHVYSGGYLDPHDLCELEDCRVVGDIATVMFREDGSYQDIPINARASGPDLSLFQRAQHAVCVVSGRRKVYGLRAALRGGFLNELILDEPTARALLALDNVEVGR